MTIPRVNFKSLLVAGILSGYGMYLVDHWFTGFLGFGMFPGTEDAWWMLTHHVDSILFALPFAWPVLYESLPGSGWLKGLAYGFLWWVVMLFILGMIAGALGAEPFQQAAPEGATGVVTAILLHLIWGFLLGVLYNPPESVSS